MEETFAYTPMMYYVYERGYPIKFVGKTWGLRKSYFNVSSAYAVELANTNLTMKHTH